MTCPRFFSPHNEHDAESSRHGQGRPARPDRLRLTALAAALAACGFATTAVMAGPQGANVRAGNATVQVNGTQTRIDQTSDRAVIDWRAFGVAPGEQVLFVQPSSGSATLNRVTGEQLSVILGRIDANGQVFLVNPNGIVVGRGAEVNVGSFVASTANVGTPDFMAGRLVFNEPGRAGAGVANDGRITAAEGGLVALVAPHVRNDGVIQARLGRVTLGAGDTFTLDLYGDGLVSLAVDPARAGVTLRDAEGRPVTSLVQQGGRIEADGGRVVLVSAATARSALDQVINLSGTVRADAVEQRGGQIVLLARGGEASVTGSLSAQGTQPGQQGGGIEVLGDRVRIGAGAVLDASGAAGGGTVRVGGAWQGSGDTPRAATTTVDAGARIAADARTRGDGGEVVVWSDGSTRHAGSISARGGAQGGDGGRVEVSGRGTLDFAGEVDAGAARGAPGQLLLDPAVMNIGLAEASLINRVLRTGTSTTVSAEQDINIGATIDGRGRIAGGGLTLNAGRDINVNEFIVTANGAVRLDAATGTVRIATGRGIFAGNAPISVTAGGDLSTGLLATSGAIAIASRAGSVDLDTPLDPSLGAVTVNAARDVRINQPVVNLRNGSGFTVVAGGDLLVNAQIDGRGGSGGGAVNLTAQGSVRFNESVVTQLGDLRVRAVTGSLVTAAGRGLLSVGDAGAAGGAIDLSAGGDFTTGVVSTTGTLTLNSVNGSLTIGQGIDPTVGTTSLRAGVDINIDTPVLNLRNGASLGALAGRDIQVRAPIDGRAASGGTAGGGVTMLAERNIVLADSIVTRDGLIALAANTGTVTQAAPAQLRAGAGPIGVTAGGNLSTGSYVTSGALVVRSTGGSISVAEPIYDSVGNTSLIAATDVVVLPGMRVENVRTGAPLQITAGRDIVIDEQVGQDRNATTLTGPITLTAGRNVLVNQDVVTRDAPLTITATTGTVTVAPQSGGGPTDLRPQVRAGNGAITVSAGGDLTIGTPGTTRPSIETPYVTTGALNLSSTGGTLFIESPIPNSTGRVTLNGGNAVHVNERIYSNGQDISITAGIGGIVMSTSSITIGPFSVALSDIDAQTGNLTLLARGDINAPSVRTAGTLSITSTEGRILSGVVLDSRNGAGVTLGLPQQVRLAGALGIDSFDTRSSPDVEARSSQGSVTLSVFAPQRLYIQAAQDVRTGGWIGSQVELVAGNDVVLGALAPAGLLRVRAGRDFVFDNAASLRALSASAGRDILFSSAPTALTFLDGAAGTMTLLDPAGPGPATIRGLSLTAGRDVSLAHPVHVADSAPASLQPTTISAGRNITIERLETFGDVSLAATSGNVTVNFPLGASVGAAPGFWNPTDLGLNSLSINAPGNGAVISLQGVRAEGNVSLIAPSGTVNSAFAVTSAGGTVVVLAPTQNISATPIPPTTRLVPPSPVSPAIAPGPQRAAPDGPAIPAAPAPGAPGLAEVAVSAPGAVDAGAGAAPGQAQGSGGEVNAEQAVVATRGVAGAAGDTAPSEADQAVAGGRGIVLYSGGRGVASSVDLGRSGNFGSVRPPPREESEDERKRRQAAVPR